MLKKNSNSGSTLIESLVAILIVGLVLTAVASALSFSVKNNAQADYRQIASGIAQDGIELFRQQRASLGWTAFYNALPTGTKCLPKSATVLSDMTSTVPCPENYTTTSPPANFRRQVSFIRVASPPKVEVTVKVFWKDGTSDRDVEVRYDFYKF